MLMIHNYIRGWSDNFSSPNGAVFSAIQRQIDPIIRYSRALWPFCPSPDNQCRPYLVNPKKWWPFRLRGQSSPSSELVHRVKSTVSTLTSGSMLRQWSQKTQKLHRIGLKQRQTLLWNGLGCACYPEWANAAPIAPTTFSCPKFHAVAN